MRSALCPRDVHPEVLLQLLPGAYPGEHYRHVDVRPVAVAAGYLLRHLHDPARTAHVQHVQPLATLHRGRTENERDRLGHAHEVARHARVCDGYGAAFGHLLLEERNHAPRGPYHVAEPDGPEHAVALGSAHGELAEALRSPHHARRVHGLVSGDEHEPPDAVPYGKLREVERGEEVVVESLARVHLDHRHVLVGGRVDDDLRAALLEEPLHPGRVPYVDHLRHDGALRPRAQAPVDLVECVLAALREHQRLRPERGDLAAYLRADRAARAGHHHAAAREKALHLGRQLRLGGTPEKRLLALLGEPGGVEDARYRHEHPAHHGVD